MVFLYPMRGLILPRGTEIGCPKSLDQYPRTCIVKIVFIYAVTSMIPVSGSGSNHFIRAPINKVVIAIKDMGHKMDQANHQSLDLRRQASIGLATQAYLTRDADGDAAAYVSTPEGLWLMI